MNSNQKSEAAAALSFLKGPNDVQASSFSKQNPAASGHTPKKLQPWNPLKVGTRVVLKRYKRERTGTIVEILDPRGGTGLAMYAVQLDYSPADGKRPITCDMMRYELTVPGVRS